MPDSNMIRFEATSVDANVSGDLATLLMETVKDGRVTVWMKRQVFVDLFEQMRLALEQVPHAADPRTNS